MDNEFTESLDGDVEVIDITRLNELGNQAVKLGLIAGHGHHQGQYEIIHQGKILTMPPEAAVTFLQGLVQSDPSAPSTSSTI